MKKNCLQTIQSVSAPPPSERVKAVLLITLTVLQLSLCTPATTQGQGSREDYERAADFGRRTSNRVFRTSVRPNWFGPNETFWYKIQTHRDGHEFVLVDPKSGKRKAAFDHQSLATALGKITNRKLKPERLNLKSLAFDEELSACKFRVGEKAFRFQLPNGPLKVIGKNDEATSETKGIKPLDRIERSEDQGLESGVLFDNRLDETLQPFWVQSDGTEKPYPKIKPKDNRWQHSYVGHKWVLRRENGTAVAAFAVEPFNELAIIDGDTPKPDKKGPRPSRRPSSRVSPNGKWIVVFDKHNVVLKSTDTGSADRLTDDGTEKDHYSGRVWWSPDSKRFVVMKTHDVRERQINMVDSSPDKSIVGKLKTITYVKPGDELDRPRPILFDVDQKQTTPIKDDLFDNPFNIGNLAWFSDSQSFTFVYNQRGHQVLRVVRVNAKSGEATALVDEISETFVCYSQKQFLQRLDETNELIWMSERSGWNHLYLIDQTTGKVKNAITKGDWVVRNVERVDAENRQIWLSVGGINDGEDPYHLHLVRVDFDGKNLTVLTPGDGNHSWSFSPNKQYLIDTYSRIDLPPVTQLVDAQTGKSLCQLETANVDELKETGWQMPERFVAKGRDGKTDIHGMIIRPTNFDPKKRYPILENIYAGPHAAFVPKSFGRHTGMAEMAELGFIVVKMDGMGTSHRSKAFHDVCWQNLGDSGFPDRVAWIKAAAKDRPYMDTSRVGIWGGSAGGQSAMRALITHGDFYSAAVADCGCHDNRVDKIWWNEQWMGWPIGPHYEEQSNATQAHRVNGDLMLIWGELDTNVDPASTTQVIDALIKADIDFEQLIVPGAGHGAAGNPYAKRRQADFFVRKLWHREPRHTLNEGTKNLVFARTPTRDLMLDLHMPDKVSDPPLVVFVHGGGWQKGNYKNCRVEWLTKHGFAVASISYRLSDEATFPAQIHDCNAAVRWLRAHAEDYGYNADKIAAIGTSAGGHLVALMATTGGSRYHRGGLGFHNDQDSRVQCVIDFYGPTDFLLRAKTQPHKVTPKESTVYRLLGGPADQIPDTAKLASAAYHVSKDDPPLMVVQGLKDTTVLPDQSQRIVDAYREADLKVEYRELPDGRHGGAQFMQGENRDAIVRFLKQHLGQ